MERRVMNEAGGIGYRISIRDIGPYSKFEGAVALAGDERLVVFGENGAGKTFISRMLRAAELDRAGKALETGDDLLREGCGKGMLSLGRTSGTDGSMAEETLAVSVKRGTPPDVAGTAAAPIVHVFNSDYVAENIWADDFGPTGGEVCGYIAGAASIDVSGDERELERLAEEGRQVTAELEGRIGEVRAELKAAGVSGGMKSFKELTVDGLGRRAREARAAGAAYGEPAGHGEPAGGAGHAGPTCADSSYADSSYADSSYADSSYASSPAARRIA